MTTKQTVIIGKVECTVQFERRRYGNKTFTWVWFKSDAGAFEPKIDPYPAVIVPQSYIQDCVNAVRRESKKHLIALIESANTERTDGLQPNYLADKDLNELGSIYADLAAQ